MVEYSITALTDRHGFYNEWRRLYAQAPAASFFQSPEWMRAWLDIVPVGADLRVLNARADGEIIMMGVFAVGQRRPPLLGLRETWFQETGDPACDAIYAEYVDFLCSAAVTHEIRRDAICTLVTNIAADGFVFRNLNKTMEAAVFSAAAVRQLSCRILREQPAYVCDLEGDAYLDRLSKSLKSKISRAIKLYGERGALTAQIAKSGAEKQRAWSHLLSLHKAGWLSRGGDSVFDNPVLRRFHEKLGENTPNAAHLFEVRAGEETIAVLYNFIHGDRVMNYQSGLKFENDNRLTPGFVAHAMAAQHYQDAGYKTYDLLAGEADYKSRLGRVDQVLTSLVIERPTWRNKLRAFIKR